jgi:hypothetical protein
MCMRMGLLAISLVIWGATALPCLASGGGHGEAEAHGGDHDAHGAHGDAAEAEDVVSEESKSGYRAIKLGEFQIRTSNSVLSRKDNVNFILHATVKNEDYPAFERHYRHHKNKVRDQVITATRLVPIEDYDDPELKKFRRRLLLRLRRALPELPIADVYISDFALSIEAT